MAKTFAVGIEHKDSRGNFCDSIIRMPTIAIRLFVTKRSKWSKTMKIPKGISPLKCFAVYGNIICASL